MLIKDVNLGPVRRFSLGTDRELVPLFGALDWRLLRDRCKDERFVYLLGLRQLSQGLGLLAWEGICRLEWILWWIVGRHLDMVDAYRRLNYLRVGISKR